MAAFPGRSRLAQAPFLLLIFIFFLSPGGPILSAQELFWDDPRILVEQGARFPRSAQGGGLMVTAWQEFVSTGAEQGQIWVSLGTSLNGRDWAVRNKIIGPIPYAGPQTPLINLEVTDDGTIYIGLAVSEARLEVYRSDDRGGSFEQAAALTSEKTILSPRLFIESDGDLLLFSLQEYNDSLSLFTSVSRDKGETWSGWKPFIEEEERRLNFLPYHISRGGIDYVIYQSLYSGGRRNTYQLYLKTSRDGGESWSDSKWLTNYQEAGDDRLPGPGNYDNQRVHGISLGDEGLGIVWERRYSTRNPQVYFGILDGEGNWQGVPEQISAGNLYCGFPRLIARGDGLAATWFDNRRGENHIILARREGAIWFDEDVSPINGASTYAFPLIFNDDVYILWENRFRNVSRLVFLAPDRSVSAPVIQGGNFTAGRRSSRSRPLFTWSLPRDSSGIKGFSYLWSRNAYDTPPRRLQLLESQRSLTLTADEDGPWYLHVSAQDYAGNWSPPATMSYYRDTTPPGRVAFKPPPTDEEGYLASNTARLAWEPPADSDVAGYSYDLQYLSSIQQSLFPPPEVRTPGEDLMTARETLSFTNRDDGLWALSVRAVDRVGNAGRPSVLYFRMNKYIPVTYISFVEGGRDEQAQLKLRITGRGFVEGGRISRVILDRDGQLPWDFTAEDTEGQFTLVSDRIIRDIRIPDAEGGSYRVGVEHPLRGVAFAGKRLALEPGGVVKFGDFSYKPEPRWETVIPGKRILGSHTIILVALMLLILVLLVFTGTRILGVLGEGRTLESQARALVRGYRLLSEIPKVRIEQMKKLGMSLRIKFTLWILTLVALVVLMVSLPLGLYMVRSQERTLGEGLAERSAVLLESLTAGARSYLPSGDVLELGLLPGQISAMEEALYATITGRGETDPTRFNHIWATNNPDIDEKIAVPRRIPARAFTQDILPALDSGDQGFLRTHYLEEPDGAGYALAEDLLGYGEEAQALRDRIGALLRQVEYIGNVVPGQTALRDEVSPLAQEMARRVNEQARDTVSEWTEELERLGEQAKVLAVQRDTESRETLSRLQETISQLDTRINEALTEIGKVSGSYPAYDPERLSRDNREFTFYKPVVYRKVGDENYFRGLVRLSVSTDNILQEMTASRNNLVRITGIVALIALGLGLLGALILASITITPIKRLVRGVELIRDTEDKEDLKGQDIYVKSRDELALLADTINDMSHGLIKAAAASKDLTLGKEVQKMFIPLEVGSDGKKRTTGKEETEYADFFGYYEGAKGVSGDYFDFKRLNDRFYALIKCDVAGKGIPASLIMVEVATIFLNFFRDWDEKKDGLKIDKLVYSINDLLEERGFKGRFAALIIVLLDVKTGKAYMCNAGDNLVHIYNAARKGMETITIPETAAAGVFPSMLVDMKGPFKQVMHPLNRGDVMFLFTDGIEEAQRSFRNEKFEIVPCDEPGIEENGEHDTHIKGAQSEELTIPRIHAIINAAFDRTQYRLYKYHNPIPDEELTFDFTQCHGSVEEGVLALVSVEKVFRLYPDPRAGENDVIRIDKKIDEFLKNHFDQYRLYFGHPVETDSLDYNSYSHLREDEQYDDLTILGIHRK